MAFDPSNPYVREAVAAGISDVWMADFIRRNPGDYHRLLAAAAGDPVAGSAPSSSSLVLADLPPSYQAQIRPNTGGGLSLAGLGGGSPMILVAVAVAAWFIYKRL